MKTNSTSRSAFLTFHVVIATILCSAGVLLALAGLSKSVTGMSATTGTPNFVPLINQPVVPDTVAPGGAGFTLTVNGTGFVSGSVVNWNASAHTPSAPAQADSSAANLPVASAYANTKLTYKVIDAPKQTYGYDVFADGRLMIHQTSARSAVVR